MAVYRLYGRREAYDGLRQLLARTIDQQTPSFDDIGPSARFCDLPVCAMHLEKLLKMETPQPGGGSIGSVGSTTGAWSSSVSSSAGGGLPGSAAARGGGGAFAGVGAGGAAAGGATLGEQDGTQAGMAMAMAMAGRQPRRHTGVEGGDFSGFSTPTPFPSSSRDQLLVSGSYSAATAAAGSAAPFTRQPELPPTAAPGWGYPDRRIGSQQPQALPPPPAPPNPLAATLKTSTSTSTSTPCDGLPQPQSFGAGPPTGLGMALGAVFGSAPAAGELFDSTSLAGARREQAALGYSGEGAQQPTSRQRQGGGGGIGGIGGIGDGGPAEGAGMTRDVAAAAWASGNVQNPQRNHHGGGDGGWDGGARGGGADLQLHREAAQHRGHGIEYGVGVGTGVGVGAGVGVGVPAASSLPAVFTSTVGIGIDTAAHHHDQQYRSSAAITAADFRGVNYGMLGVGDDSSPGAPPTPAPDL